MEEKIKELKEKFEGSNKYMITLSYEDIKELFAIIEVLKNTEPTFLIKDLNNPKLKEVTLEDVKGLIKQGREEVKDTIKAKIEEVEQWELYNMKIPKLSTLDERLGAKIGIKYVFADTDEEAIQKAERLKANGKYYSVILEKITYKYKTVKKWED